MEKQALEFMETIRAVMHKGNNSCFGIYGQAEMLTLIVAIEQLREITGNEDQIMKIVSTCMETGMKSFKDKKKIRDELDKEINLIEELLIKKK